MRGKTRRGAKSKVLDKAYMIDIDGVICNHIPNEFPERMITAKELPGAREWINSRYNAGDYICFFTARLEEHRKVTEEWLREHRFRYHEIIFGKPRGGNYHYIDGKHVRATTFRGRFTPLVSESHGIEVFEDS
ncbi:MAG: phosphoheptose isomerase [Nitrososphaerales archaeon]